MTPQTTPKYSEPLREIVEVLPRDLKSKRKWRGLRVVLECGHEIEISASRMPRRTRCYICGREALAAARAAMTCKHGVFPKERCIECQNERLRAELHDLADRATELDSEAIGLREIMESVAAAIHDAADVLLVAARRDNRTVMLSLDEVFHDEADK